MRKVFKVFYIKDCIFFLIKRFCYLEFFKVIKKKDKVSKLLFYALIELVFFRLSINISGWWKIIFYDKKFFY